ncbi:MAG: hypothetical protein K1X44_07290 [Alphaproteobacteria bacterium]|nr:hypothetical protein [Alphaproteobacteria bacterium]
MTYEIPPYNHDQALIFCTKLIQGHLITDICHEGKDALFSLPTLLSWLTHNPEFQKLYKTACDVQAHNLVNQSLRGSSEISTDSKENMAYERHQLTKRKMALTYLLKQRSNLDKKNLSSLSMPIVQEELKEQDLTKHNLALKPNQTQKVNSKTNLAPSHRSDGFMGRKKVA